MMGCHAKGRLRAAHRQVIDMHVRLGCGRLARILVGIVDGNLAHQPGKRDGQFPRRRFDTEQDVRNGRPAHGAGVPGVYERVDMLEDVLDGQWPARKNECDDRLAGLPQGAHQVDLGAGQIDVCARVRLARQDGLLAEKDDHGVGRPGSRKGFGKATGIEAAAGFNRAYEVDIDPVAHRLPNRLQRCLTESRVPVEYPGPQLLVGLIGERPDDRDRIQFIRIQRQGAALVLEQYEALQRRFAGHREVFVVGQRGKFSGIRIRVLEQAEIELDAKNFTDQLIDAFDADLAVFDKLRQVLRIRAAHHLHVHARGDRLARRIPAVCREPVISELVDRVPVADHEAVEIPLVAQYVLHQEPVAAGGNPVQVAERRHQCRHTRVDRRLERRQVDVTQFVLGDVGGVVVPPRFAGAVTGKMLGAGRNGPGRRQVVALIAFDHGDGETARQVRILAEALGNSAPSRVARNIDHRRESPVHTCLRRFQ